MSDLLRQYAAQLESQAKHSGLDYFPVDFELVPPSFMTEVAVYGLPVRMPHWSFGVRYIYQLIQHRMGHSKLFEVVFPGNPGRAYLSNNNSVEENTLVVAHVLGHADFARNNRLFQQSQKQVGYHIVELAASRARQIGDFIEAHGIEQVERVLDVALSLEQHIDVNQPLHRERFPEFLEQRDKPEIGEFQARYSELPGERNYRNEPKNIHHRTSVPPQPEYDLLWFIAQYAPEMEDWERDIFLMVREESYYFFPVFSCQIMNEGWASYWHARLLRESDFLPNQLYLEAIKTHSDVVRPYADKHQTALAINPYHVGFTLWESIVEKQGMDFARKILHADDDFSFIRNHLTGELAEKMHLFQYLEQANGKITVSETDIEALRETLLQPRFNFGAPHIAVIDVLNNGALILNHDHLTDSSGLDLERAEKVINYIQRVWQRKVVLYTVDSNGRDKVLEAA